MTLLDPEVIAAMRAISRRPDTAHRVVAILEGGPSETPDEREAREARAAVEAVGNAQFRASIKPRPPRREPPLSVIGEHWGLPLCCVRCGATELLERAHIIDRARDGLDHASNLQPLCRRCHFEQPSFGNGDEAEALAWFATKRESEESGDN